MSNVGKLLGGFKVFKSTTYQKEKDIIHHLIEQGHKPSTMIISCCDLRISPREIFAANPGDLYIINNVGGLVPKYETKGVHGILAAIEYAVTILEVENIIVLGHAKCDSIKMMMSDQSLAKSKQLSESMKTWLSISNEARDAVKKQLAEKSEEEQQTACEHESLIISLRNLMTYPYVSKRLSQNKLNIFGWHFNIETGDILGFNPQTLIFETLT